MSATQKVTVLSDDSTYLKELLEPLPDGSKLHLLDWSEVLKLEAEAPERVDEIAGRFRNMLVLSTASRLSQVTPFLHLANRKHHLQALLIRDREPRWLPQMLRRANTRALTKMLAYEEPDMRVPRRVLFAWMVGGQNELIADARVMDDHLFIVSCAAEQFELSFADIPALARIPKEERDYFEIVQDGSYIHWPSSEVDVDLDALRYVTDETYRRRADKERMEREEEFGGAVRSLRKRSGLRQQDIPGLSARQVRRIEKGETATVSALEKLAAAHGREIDDYLEAVAREMKGD